MNDFAYITHKHTAGECNRSCGFLALLATIHRFCSLLVDVVKPCVWTLFEMMGFYDSINDFWSILNIKYSSTCLS